MILAISDRRQISDLQARLHRFNTLRLGDYKVEPLWLGHFDEAGGLRGGILGSTALDWLSIDLLYIDEECRRRRFGSSLLQAAEVIARERGCKYACVDTLDFQAPGFYLRNGFKEIARLPCFPHQHVRLMLTKQLAGEA